MVQKCIRCARMIGNFEIYCKQCQEEIEKKFKKIDKFNEIYKSADYFERIKLKEEKEKLLSKKKVDKKK